MIQSTIEKIEEKVRKDGSISAESKTELLSLLEALKPEIAELSKEQKEHAESIAGFMERSSHEALRQEKNPTLHKISIEGLNASVEEFAESYPGLVKTVNQIATTLANMGI